MSNFIRLVQNEQVKLYVRVATWVMFGILAAIILLGAVIVRFLDDGSLTEYGDNWREEIQEENQKLTQEMEEMSSDSADGGFSVEMINGSTIERNNYYLENDIKPHTYDAWQFVYENAGLASIISLFTIIVAAGIIANEFKWGTIKLLLIRPVSRLKVMAAKYVSVLLFALTMLAFLLVFSWISGAIIFGVDGMNPSIVVDRGGEFIQLNVVKETIMDYSFSMVNLVMMATFAFMISSIFRSSGMAIGLAIFLMFAGNSVVGFVSQYDWAKFILFANTDLKQYTAGREPWIEGMTMGFSISMLLVYYVVFLAASWLAFTKRDVAGH
ncbi:ABC transporter permease [Aquibacillus koreensis]|uniref:ABC transporter permease n=1 Tax=Aquibacillus koreensis TaxID=279446 RepID=A0A9X4AJP0_9BACI|nr:ABC transporter permease [Aquibacillus koreensis]MCT2536230.1 ABC transporter permease [Aquibacillus koreensis]MDC3422216.1 ABC transporter permease [Aquibacillus koreensis]